MDKLGPVKEALVTKEDDCEEWDLEQLVENLRKFIDRHPLPVDFCVSSYNNNNLLFKKTARDPKQEWREKDVILFEN